MRNVRRLALCASVSAIALLPEGAFATPPAARMLDEVNAFRAAHGVAPLGRSARLARSSFAYSRLLVRHDRFAHGAGPSLGAFRGEVLEWHPGRRPLVRSALRAWRQSPQHRALLLDRRFRRMGAGRTFGTFRGAPATMWVLHLGG